MKYQDSAFQKTQDSLYINEEDTIFYHKKFLITGFFRVYVSGKIIYSQGEMDGDRKVGEWLTFQKQSETKEWKLIRKVNYDNLGNLQGTLTNYDVNTGKPIEIHTYKDDSQEGIQQFFYPSGKLHIQYEKDGFENIINTYVVYNEQGTELFKTDLGIEGTGYIRFYDADNKIEWEGGFVNKKKQGWHRIYSIDVDTGKEILGEKKLYKEDKIISRTILFFPWDKIASGNKADSAVYKTLSNGGVEVTYYEKGAVINKENQ